MIKYFFNEYVYWLRKKRIHKLTYSPINPINTEIFSPLIHRS